ncbi:uncharacterized protein LOC126264536 [Aethina tumida]|uniref:uncharacterized protein LOC126264536 n=1 Tax=Aethina tumida TaxID=116153 RepID=UPI002149069D|nr:uncharacterized protein LOC126264536 [Aethina tumida]
MSYQSKQIKQNSITNTITLDDEEAVKPQENFSISVKTDVCEGKDVLYKPTTNNKIGPNSMVNKSEPFISDMIGDADVKIEKFLKHIKETCSPIGKLVLVGKKSSPTFTYLNTALVVADYKMRFHVANGSYQLYIENELMAETDYDRRQMTSIRLHLANMTIAKLKEECFTIINKENYEEISLDYINNLDERKAFNQENEVMGRVRYMMEKLGLDDSKEKKSDVKVSSFKHWSKLNKILYEYLHSNRLTVLVLSPSYTKEERCIIHRLANFYRLKSKTIKIGDHRRTTIAKKWKNDVLIKILLKSNCDSIGYYLEIPSKYREFWANLCATDEKGDNN